MVGGWFREWLENGEGDERMAKGGIALYGDGDWFVVAVMAAAAPASSP
jgi:hypothetical protein